MKEAHAPPSTRQAPSTRGPQVGSSAWPAANEAPRSEGDGRRRQSRSLTLIDWLRSISVGSAVADAAWRG
jgi:hypothetical protein